MLQPASDPSFPKAQEVAVQVQNYGSTSNEGALQTNSGSRKVTFINFCRKHPQFIFTSIAIAATALYITYKAFVFGLQDE